MKFISNYYIFFILLTLPLFSQCQSVQNRLPEKYQVTQYTSNNLTLKKGKWEFKSLDTISARHYSVKDIKGNTYLSYFDDLSKKLNILSIDECKIIKQIDLKTLATKENHFQSFYLHNVDSIFIQLEKNILLIDMEGKIKLNVPINQSNYSKMTLANMGYGFPIVYDSLSNNLLIGQYCSGCRFYEKKYFQQNLEISLNLSTKKFKETSFIFPQKYQDEYFGFAITAYRQVKDSLSIFTFQADPNIYLFNRKDGTVDIRGGKSKHDTSIKGLSLDDKNDSNKKMNHLTLSPLYLEVIWDPFRRLYYRFFLKSQSERNENGNYNIFMDKPVILMVFDEKLNVMDEIILDSSLNCGSALVTASGFLIPKIDKTNVKTLSYEIFKFEK